MGLLNLLRLRGYGRDMMPAGVGLLLRRRTRFNATCPTVVAHVSVVDDDGRVIRVVNYGGVYVIHVSVVREVATVPPTTFVAVADIAKSIVDATIKPHLRAPIPFVENERAAAPTPVAWSPKEADLRRL